ncbi:MAG TPA: methyltransferase [Candidatus Dormibacteraeota bacterium]|jgi:16S rRNA G1207 methylase RsmC|nr:methyltransferase [Candidatus Dormibacteraeota bacterium]HEX2680346.1 methyltransferase [Candidatus Dormibacteraeota bacterium]
MSIPKSHYFDPEPPVPSRRRTVHLHLDELALELEADRGVFGSRGIDLGTLTLLREAPPPPAAGDVLDLGCGYGPIAIALARQAPGARVWAVDVNERALELTRSNAAANQAANVEVRAPAAVPEGLRFAAIYSNPPVRVGKAPLHELLKAWLPRLEPGATAYLVVQRNLGSDSLAAWLAKEGFVVSRLKSKKGYRVLEVKLGS